MAASWLSLMALVPLSVSMSRKIVAGAQQEGVVARLLDRPQPFAGRDSRIFCTMRTLCISIGISHPLDRRMLMI